MIGWFILVRQKHYILQYMIWIYKSVEVENLSMDSLLDQDDSVELTVTSSTTYSRHSSTGSRSTFEFTIRVNLSGPSLYCIARTLG